MKNKRDLLRQARRARDLGISLSETKDRKAAAAYAYEMEAAANPEKPTTIASSPSAKVVE